MDQTASESGAPEPTPVQRWVMAYAYSEDDIVLDDGSGTPEAALAVLHLLLDAADPHWRDWTDRAQRIARQRKP